MRKKYNYRKLRPREYSYINRFLDDIHRAAVFYEATFVNKKVTFYTAKTSITVIASVTNFMHLCGISYLRGSKNFFLSAKYRKIDLDKVLIKKDGTTFQKLQVLSAFPELISGNVRLTGRGRFLVLDYDYALRTSRQLLALTLINQSAKAIPQSLLNLHKKMFEKGASVVRIESQDFNSDQITVLLEEQSK